MESKPGNYARIYTAVRRVPKGRVATYGQIARLAGLGRHARQVGYALSNLEDDTVPWHRIINAKGEISLRTDGLGHRRQRQLLEAEGVRFDERGKVFLERYLWKSDRRR